MARHLRGEHGAVQHSRAQLHRQRLKALPRKWGCDGVSALAHLHHAGVAAIRHHWHYHNGRARPCVLRPTMAQQDVQCAPLGRPQLTAGVAPETGAAVRAARSLGAPRALRNVSRRLGVHPVVPEVALRDAEISRRHRQRHPHLVALLLGSQPLAGGEKGVACPAHGDPRVGCVCCVATAPRPPIVQQDPLLRDVDRQHGVGAARLEISKPNRRPWAGGRHPIIPQRAERHQLTRLDLRPQCWPQLVPPSHQRLLLLEHPPAKLEKHLLGRQCSQRGVRAVQLGVALLDERHAHLGGATRAGAQQPLGVRGQPVVGDDGGPAPAYKEAAGHLPCGSIILMHRLCQRVPCQLQHCQCCRYRWRDGRAVHTPPQIRSAKQIAAALDRAPRRRQRP